MDLNKLPGFPDEAGRPAERLPRPDEGPAAAGETVAAVFAFASGLALANVALLAGLRGIGLHALALAGLEVPLLFAAFAVLVALSWMAPLDRAVEEAHTENRVLLPWLSGRLSCLLFVVCVGVGVALGLGFLSLVARFFTYLQDRGHPLQSHLDHLLAIALIGAVAGLAVGAAVCLAGGTPDVALGRPFTALGKGIPAVVRGFLILGRDPGVRVFGAPWIEGLVWTVLVVGPLVYLLR